MALENASGPEELKKPQEVQTYMTNTGDHWYRDPETNAIVQFDDDAETERIRQHANPDTEPLPGFPRFSSHVENREIPSDTFDQKRTEVETLLNNIVDLPDKQKKKFAQQFERATDDKKVDVLRTQIDRYLERRASTPAAAPSTTGMNTPHTPTAPTQPNQLNQPNTPPQTSSPSPNAAPNTPPSTPNTPPQTPPQTPAAPNTPPPIPNAPFVPSAPTLPGTPPVVPRGRRSTGGGSGTIRPMGSLDRLSRWRNKSAEIDRKATLVNPVSGESMEESADMTLAEIMADTEQQQMFINKFLHREDPAFAQTITAKIADGTLFDEKEDKELEKLRKKYLKERNEAESVKEYLTPELYKKIADVDPRIGEIVGKIGMDRAEGLIDAELMDLMITDPKKFHKMRDSLKRHHELDNGALAKKTEKGLEHYLRELNISDEDFIEATKLGNPIDIERRFKELAEAKFPLYLKALNFRGWVTGRSPRELRLHYENNEQLLDEANKHLKSVGSVLHATITPEVKMRIQKLAMDGILEDKVPDTVSTIEEYRAVKHENSDATIQKGFEAYKEAEAAKYKITDWTTDGNPAKLDALKDTYAKAVFDKQQKHKTSGLYAALLRLLFGLNTSPDDIKKKLH